MKTNLIANAAISAVVNLLVIAGLPFLLYFAYQKGRHKRGFAEIAQRAGFDSARAGTLGTVWFSRSPLSQFS